MPRFYVSNAGATYLGPKKKVKNSWSQAAREIAGLLDNPREVDLDAFDFAEEAPPPRHELFQENDQSRRQLDRDDDHDRDEEKPLPRQSLGFEQGRR